MSADDLEYGGTTKREAAVEWLQAELADGRVLATVVTKDAEVEGIRERTLQRAKKTLKVESVKDSKW